jgi:hypothetical protein
MTMPTVQGARWARQVHGAATVANKQARSGGQQRLEHQDRVPHRRRPEPAGGEENEQQARPVAAPGAGDVV